MKNLLRFGERWIKPTIRRLSEMRNVVYDKDWLMNSKDINLYYMYRDIARNEKERMIIHRNNLRYDITIIPPLKLGCEYVKTTGHYHPVVSGTNLSYPEIYEVLDGNAHYLLQKAKNGRILDVVLVEAKKNEKIIIPPSYGHITINPSNRKLKMANFVSNRFLSIYEPIRKGGGGAYFELIGRRFVKNENYGEIPELRKIKPIDPSEIGLKRTDSLYTSIVKNPKILEFLNMPQNYSGLFKKVLR